MRVTTPRAAVLVGAALLCFGAAATASAQVEMTGVRAMGLGEAFTGGATGTGALFYNPAGVSSLMMYSVEGSYVYDQATGRNLVHASIVDGKSNPVLGGGLGYTFSVSPQEAILPDFTGHDFYGALSAPVFAGLLLVGVTGHYISYDQFGEDLANGFTLDTGLLLTLGDYFNVGLSARDLIEVENSGRNRQLRAGLSYRVPLAHFGVDTFFDFRDGQVDTSLAGGLEIVVAQIVPIRVGYQYAGGEGHHILAGGFGWRSRTAGLDVLYRQDLNDMDHRMAGVALDLYL
jgi:hypothetical protein